MDNIIIIILFIINHIYESCYSSYDQRKFLESTMDSEGVRSASILESHSSHLGIRDLED